jgi:hypothetical protein
VTAPHILLGGRCALREREALVQNLDARLRFRVPARRVQAGEIAMAYELDRRTASSVSSSVAAAT